jgi:antitoxin MazE
MSMTIHSKVIKIGNSRGIRIPRTILEQVGLSDDIEMKIEGDRLVIQASRHPRHGWEEHYARMAEKTDDRLLVDIPSSSFDEDEWTW